jgi:hypothetical protein
MSDPFVYRSRWLRLTWIKNDRGIERHRGKDTGEYCTISARTHLRAHPRARERCWLKFSLKGRAFLYLLIHNIR